MSNENPILETKDLHRSFSLLKNQVEVLRGVNLQIHRGEAISIMGASGAGKSTLLHILGGLDRPTAGTVIFKNRDLYRMSATRRTECRAHSFGFVFQAYHLLPELSIEDNVLLPVMHRLNWLQQATRYRAHARELLQQVGLEDRATHRPMELSGGEQQRASIARALISEPEIVFADEPTGNLDSHTGEQVLQHLFALTREQGNTLILVTHNDAVAARCNRVVVMKDGQIETDQRSG